WPTSPGCASRLVAAAAVLAAACACAMTCWHCAVTTRAQTSGIRGLASALRALFAPPQVMSRQKPVMASPVPHTSGLISLRSSAASSHSTCVLIPGDLEKHLFQPRPLDGHRFSDHPACHQGAVHVAAAVVLDDELPLRVPGRPPGQQPGSCFAVRGTDLDPDPPPDRTEHRGRAFLDEPATDDHGPPIAHLLDLGEQVTGQEYRRPLRGQAAQQAPDVLDTS